MKSLLLLSLASVASASSPSVHVPLVRRAHAGYVTSDELAAERDALDTKYNRAGAKVQPRQNDAGVHMVNQNGDISYYALMNVGTPPTPYAVALDTGSSDLWFQSPSCVGCDGATLSTASTSMQQSGRPFAIRYGSGAVEGTIVADNVEMGGFAVQNQVMGLVNRTSGVLLSGKTAGLLGLAFQVLSNTESVPFWEALVSGGRWAQPYTNVTTVREEEYGGEFRMGGTNSTLYTGDIEYIDMPSTVKAYWSIPLRQITVNGGQPMVITNLGVTSLAAIDTGTTLIGGPPDIVAAIYAQIPNAQRGTGNLARYWIYPCSQSVNITFNFGGRVWPMASPDFKLLTNNPNICVGAIFEASLGGLGNPNVPQWIVGDAFLKNVYSVFRYEPPSIGFAELSAFARGSQPQLNIPTGTTPLSPAGATVTTTVTATPNGSAVGATRGSGSLLTLVLGSFSAAVAFLIFASWTNEAQAHTIARSAGSVFSASLARRAKSGNVLDFAAERKALLAKYKKQHKNGTLSARQNIIQEDMVNQNMDVMYYATLQVGTPPQPYSVILGDVACAPCTGKKIDPTRSSTIQNSSTPFSLAYGIGSVKGTLVNDIVSIGSSAFTVQDQVWGLVNYTLGTPVPGDIAGLMGLGFKNLAASQATPFWETLVSSGQWNDPAMSFWMTRYNNDSSATDAEFGGEFIMGGTNAALYTGDIDFVSLPYASDPTFWAIPLQRVTINGQEVSTSSTLAAIDTATSLIGGPPNEVQTMYAAVPNAQRGQGLLEGFWTYPCSQQVELTLNFGGRTWPMSPADFALTTNDPDTCVGAIFETTLGNSENPQIPEWYIGASFLKNVYSVFRYDPPAVGFAQLSEAAHKREPVPLANGSAFIFSLGA